MERNELGVVEEWLCEYFAYFDDVFIEWRALESMATERISLPDILSVLGDPTITEYERDWNGCLITVTGRSCDNEKITVFGGFNSETLEVSVFDVARTPDHEESNEA